MKKENLTGAPFSVVQTADDNSYSVTLGISDSDFEIKYYACPESPEFCGRGLRSRAVKVQLLQCDLKDVS